jgi:hypothetical protein
MADGVSAATGTSMCTTAVANWTWTQLHKGAPGAAGTSNVSSVTTRKATTWASASGSSVSANGTLPKWTSWAGTNGEAQTAISGWDASSSGNFQAAVTLSASVTMNTGDELDLTAITVAVPNAS